MACTHYYEDDMHGFLVTPVYTGMYMYIEDSITSNEVTLYSTQSELSIPAWRLSMVLRRMFFLGIMCQLTS